MFLFGQNHVVYQTFSLVFFILLEVVFGFCSHRNFVKLFDLGDFGVVIGLKVETVSCHCDGLVGSPREVILLRCGLGRFAPGNLSFARLRVLQDTAYLVHSILALLLPLS